MTDPEITMQEGLDVEETQRTPGWAILKQRLEDERAALCRQRDLLAADIAEEVTKGKTLEQIGVEMATLAARIEGIDTIFTITRSFTRKKEEAQGKLRKNHE